MSSRSITAASLPSEAVGPTAILACRGRLDFDLNQMGRIGEPCHLDHGRHRSDTAEDFLVSTANLFLGTSMSVTYIRVRTTRSAAAPAAMRAVEGDGEEPLAPAGTHHLGAARRPNRSPWCRP